MVVAFKTDPPASEKDFHAVGRASAKIQRWEGRAVWLDDSEGENGVH